MTEINFTPNDDLLRQCADAHGRFMEARRLREVARVAAIQRWLDVDLPAVICAQFCVGAPPDSIVVVFRGKMLMHEAKQIIDMIAGKFKYIIPSFDVGADATSFILRFKG